MTHVQSRSWIALVVLLAGCSRPPETPGRVEPAGAPKAGGAAVTSDDVTSSPNIPIEQQLMRRVPGILVARTEEGGIAIRIRGSSSLTGNNEPLYILDGVPFQPGPGGSLVGINPYDIASIKVLKDAADITMYGARGANGVIVIKTKRP